MFVVLATYIHVLYVESQTHCQMHFVEELDFKHLFFKKTLEFQKNQKLPTSIKLAKHNDFFLEI